jgi:hypothetical protein
MGLSRLSCLPCLVPADARHTWFSLVAVLEEQGLWSDDIARELRYAASCCCVEEECSFELSVTVEGPVELVHILLGRLPTQHLCTDIYAQTYAQTDVHRQMCATSTDGRVAAPSQQLSTDSLIYAQTSLLPAFMRTRQMTETPKETPKAAERDPQRAPDSLASTAQVHGRVSRHAELLTSITHANCSRAELPSTTRAHMQHGCLQHVRT